MIAFDDSQRFSSCSLMRDGKSQFLQMVHNFSIFNPHADVTLHWHGESQTHRATDPTWPKWRPCDPTSAHWYDIEAFIRLVAAYLAADQEEDRDRTVREFIAEFRGLTGSSKQKAVLGATGLARKTLSSLVCNGELDRPLLVQLLAAMKQHSKPVKPRQLGVLGKDHIEKQLQSLGCDPETIRYICKLGDSPSNPWVLECAFGWNDSLQERQLLTAVNWSPAIVNPFRQLGDRGMSLDSLLESQRAGEDEPVVVLVHLAIARPTFADRGKSTLIVGG